MTTRGNPHQPNGDHHRQRPPQPPYSNHPHRHYYAAAPSSSRASSSSSSASVKGCCCCLFLLLSFLALLVLAILLVMVLAVKPKKPQVDLEQVDVQYVGVTPNDPATATATLSLAIRLLFAVVNPNRVGIRYGDSRFTVMYRGIPLGRASVPGFYQEPHSVKDVVATIAVDRVSLLQADAAELIRDAMLNDRLEFRVLGDVAARIRVLHFDSPRVQVSVDCVIVISPRKQSLTYKQCGIDALNV